MKNKGFTLIEFLIYIAIVAMILVLTSGFIWNIIYGESRASVFREVEQNTRQALTKISYHLSQATDIAISPSTIVLVMEDTALNPTNIYLADEIIYISQGSTGPFKLTNDEVKITDLNFTDLSYLNPDAPKTIKIEIDVSYNNTSGRSEYDFSDNFTTSITLKHFTAGSLPVPQTMTLRPSSDNAVFLNRGGSCPDAICDDPSDDNCECISFEDLTSSAYVYAGSRSGPVSGEDIYNLENPIPDSGQITKVTVYFNGAHWNYRGAGWQYGRGQTVIEFPDQSKYYGQSEILPYGGIGSEQWFFTEYAQKPGGGEWQWHNIDELRVGVSLETLSRQAYAWATEIKVEVEYILNSETLRPNGQNAGDIGLVAFPALGTNYIYAGDRLKDTLVAINAGAGQDLYSLDNFTLGGGIISKVIIFYRGAFWTSQSGSWRGRTLIEINGNSYYGAYSPLAWYNNPEWYSTEYTTNPATCDPVCDPWTWADINNLKVGVWIEATRDWSWAEEVKVVVEFESF